MRTPIVSRDRLRIIFALVILTTWLTTLPEESFTHTVHPSVQILMMALAGWLFGPAIVGRESDNGSKKKER